MSKEPGALHIYHNPRCSKSRQTLALLTEKGIEPEIIDYLNCPPDAATLKAILDELGLEPRGLMRRRPPYNDLGRTDAATPQEALIQAMVDHPILIERPIVLSGSKAALGRPPETVLEIL